MDCTEYRRSILAAPHEPNAAMLAHVAACQDCARYTERLLHFEGRLEQALRVDLAPAADGSVPLAAGRWLRRTSRSRRRGLAIAASLLLATFGAGSLWLAAPARSLAAAVVDHMAGEPDAWARTEVPVPGTQLNEVMTESNMALKSGAGLVSYASSCLFRGHQVPHLVVQTARGPVTVMVLTHEPVRRGVYFDEQGYRGRIVPVPGHGSLAVLEHAPDTDAAAVDAVATQVLGAIEWERPPPNTSL